MMDPSTPDQWQEAVDLADFYLRLHSARLYGLVSGGPPIDVHRCEELLERGARHGYRPAPGLLEAITRTLATGRDDCTA